jgi:isoleucyl-tRNA synthetase
VLRTLAEELARAMAPLLPHLAEDLWQNLPYRAAGGAAESVFLSGWTAAAVEPAAVAAAAAEFSAWTVVRAVRADVNKALELARTQKLIGASLDAAVFIHAPNATVEALLRSLPNDGVNDLRFVMLASSVELCADSAAVVGKGACVLSAQESATGCTVGVAPSAGVKCERCWNYCGSVGQDAAHPAICHRCVAAVNALGMAAPPKAVAAA